MKHGASWPVTDLLDIDDFLQHARINLKWSRVTVGGAASAIRAWLRFLFVTRRSGYDISAAVVLPPAISYAAPPRAMPWSAIGGLRRGIDAKTPVGLRDAAQYTLLCAYGRGSVEIINLQLEDIDWDGRILHIRRGKTKSAFDLPLLPAVARAIAPYLRHGRPQTSNRSVFVNHVIPFGPMSHSAIGQSVKYRSQRANGQISISGTHVFRHSFATSQLEHGTTLNVS